MSNDFGHWTLPVNIVTIPSDTIGFIYCITDNNGKKYNSSS